MGIRWQLFPKLNFIEFLDQNIKIQGRRLLSLHLKDTAYGTQLIFLIFHTFVCNFLIPRTVSRCLSSQPNLQTNVQKIIKINWASSSQTASFKLGQHILLPSILTSWFTNCAIQFWKKLFAIGFPYKHCNFFLFPCQNSLENRDKDYYSAQRRKVGLKTVICKWLYNVKIFST